MSKRLPDNLRKGLWLSAGFALAVFITLALWADVSKLKQAALNFRWGLLPLALALAFSNYLIRFARWQLYLKQLKIRLPVKQSFAVFLAGLTMSITPGKFGEVLKSQFLKNIGNVPISHSAPVVLAERFTDLIGVVALASVGVFTLNHGMVVFVSCIALIVFLLAIISWRPIALFMFEKITRIKYIAPLAQRLRVAYESAYQLFAWRMLLPAIPLAIFAWFAECLAFHVTIHGFPDCQVPLQHSIFIYAFATLFGAVTMLPGGLGTTEGSMAGLLHFFQGIGKGQATAITLIIRICTLWFAILVGILALLHNWKLLTQNQTPPSKLE